MSSLLPASKSETFPIKLHHLSLLDAPSRVKNAITQLELLNAGLQAREGVDQRFNRAEQRRARENVLKGLLDSILQELRALKQEEADDLGVPRTPAKSTIRPNTPSSDEDDVEDMDDLHKYKQYIKQSSMPEEIRKTCLKELKRLKQTSPMSPEYNKNRDYLDWMLKLPWSKSTYDSPNAKKIDHEFLERARKQLELDHFGIENVKDRLLQYLAVLKLKREQFEDEQERLRLKEEEEKKSIEQKGQQQQQQEAGEDEEATGKEVAMKDSKPSKKAKKATPTPKPNQFRDKGPIICLV